MQALTWQRVLAYLAAWLVSVIGVVLAMWSTGAAVLQATLWYGAHRSPASLQRDLITGSDFGWTAEAVGYVATLLLLCIGVGVAIGLEYYYRTGAGKKQLLRRFVRVSVAQTLIVAAGVAIVVLTRLL